MCNLGTLTRHNPLTISLGEDQNERIEDEIDHSPVYKDKNKNLRKIESLISPISNNNYSQICTKLNEWKRDYLEKISEISEYNENCKDIDVGILTDHKNTNYIEANNNNDLSLLKEFIFCPKTNDIKNDYKLENNEESTIQIKQENYNNWKSINSLAWSNRNVIKMVEIKPRVKPTFMGIIHKYKHLFEDIEETSNPKTGRAHYGSIRKTNRDVDESDFTSFRNQNISNTNNISDISLDKIENHFKIKSEIRNENNNTLHSFNKAEENNILNENDKSKNYIISSSLFNINHGKETIQIDDGTTRNE